MSISQADVIDFVARPPRNPNAVHLVIVDDLEWAPLDDHLALLKSKVNAYVDVLVSGRLASHVSPPLPPNPTVTLVVLVVHQPPVEAKPFLDRTEEVLRGLNARFQVLSASAFEEFVRLER